MWQENVAQKELQSNFAGLVSRIQKSQNWVATKGKTPDIPAVSMKAQANSSAQGQVNVRFTEFEFPFP